MSTLILVTLAVFLLNIPFGYWRINVQQFSFQWFLAIHAPVPFIIGLRLVSDLGFAWHTYVFLVGAFFLGQRTGALLHRRKLQRGECSHDSSCLVMDLYRCRRAA